MTIIDIKPNITTIGTGKPKVIILAATHGNEPVGVKIFEKLKKTINQKKGSITFIICNRPALARKVRYIDSDLNRSFPGNKNGGLEARLAYKITKEVKSCDLLIDIHSCSTPSMPFCIIRDNNKKAMHVATDSGLPNIVIYPLATQKGASTIDVVACGIGLELGLHNKRLTFIYGYNAIINILSAAGLVSNKMICISEKEDKKIIKIIKYLKKTPSMKLNGKIKNLTLIKKGRVLGKVGNKRILAKEDFYPVLYGEHAYSNTLCLVGKEEKA